MISEFEAYIGQVLPQVKETYLRAKEREAFGQLRKLFHTACQDLSPARKLTANLLLFPPRLQLESVYWPVSPPVFRELFQTDLYGIKKGLTLQIPNPELTQHNRQVLKVEANRVSLKFFRRFNSDDVNQYQVRYKMSKDSPLTKNPHSLHRAKYLTKKVEELNQDPKMVLELLEFTCRFALEALRTKGFSKGGALLF